MRCRVFSSVALLALVGGVRATRDRSCDDGSVLLTACAFTPTDSDAVGGAASFCTGKTKILALQAGCYVCVDPQSCIVPYDEGAPKHFEVQTEGYEEDLQGTPVEDRYERDPKYEDDAETQAKGYEDDLQNVETPKEEEEENADPLYAEAAMHKATTSKIALQLVRTEHAGAQHIKIHAHQAAVEAAVVAPGSPHGVSKWYFLAPAFLALVSVGIAIRSRMHRRRPHAAFERVDAEDAEEINPFCADPECNPQQDDDREDLEYGKQRGGNDDSDEDNNYHHKR